MAACSIIQVHEYEEQISNNLICTVFGERASFILVKCVWIFELRINILLETFWQQTVDWAIHKACSLQVIHAIHWQNIHLPKQRLYCEQLLEPHIVRITLFWQMHNRLRATDRCTPQIILQYCRYGSTKASYNDNSTFMRYKAADVCDDTNIF